MYPYIKSYISAPWGVFGLLITCSEAEILPFKDMYSQCCTNIHKRCHQSTKCWQYEKSSILKRYSGEIYSNCV